MAYVSSCEVARAILLQLILHSCLSSETIAPILQTILTVTCDSQQCDILSSVDPDEPLQPPFKRRGSKLCLTVA